MKTFCAVCKLKVLVGERLLTNNYFILVLALSKYLS